jgi:hypothetical protein
LIEPKFDLDAMRELKLNMMKGRPPPIDTYLINPADLPETVDACPYPPGRPTHGVRIVTNPLIQPGVVVATYRGEVVAILNLNEPAAEEAP